MNRIQKLTKENTLKRIDILKTLRRELKDVNLNLDYMPNNKFRIRYENLADEVYETEVKFHLTITGEFDIVELSNSNFGMYFQKFSSIQEILVIDSISFDKALKSFKKEVNKQARKLVSNTDLI